MTAVTEKSHPAVFRAFRAIELDNGMINRLEPARKAYDVPFSHKHMLPEVEVFLAGFSESDLDEFCNGCDQDIALLHGASTESGVLAGDFLNAFFDGWEDTNAR